MKGAEQRGSRPHALQAEVLWVSARDYLPPDVVPSIALFVAANTFAALATISAIVGIHVFCVHESKMGEFLCLPLTVMRA